MIILIFVLFFSCKKYKKKGNVIMKIKDLKNYGIPSYILNIWEKQTKKGVCNTPLQEDAVRNYGILSCGGGGFEY